MKEWSFGGSYSKLKVKVSPKIWNEKLLEKFPYKAKRLRSRLYLFANIDLMDYLNEHGEINIYSKNFIRRIDKVVNLANNIIHDLIKDLERELEKNIQAEFDHYESDEYWKEFIENKKNDGEFWCLNTKTFEDIEEGEK